MMIPELATAFGCFTLEDGTKFIGWFQLVTGAIFMVLFMPRIIKGDHIFSILSDEKTDHKGFLVGVLIILFLAILVHFIGIIFLLLGVQKKKPAFMRAWLVSSVMGLIATIRHLSSFEIAIVFVMNLYFTWVVYSCYRQLSNTSNSSKGPAHETLQGDVPQFIYPNLPPAYSLDKK